MTQIDRSATLRISRSLTVGYSEVESYQHLYLLHHTHAGEKSYTCLGFDVCLDRIDGYLAYLGRDPLGETRRAELRGTLSAYRLYHRLSREAGQRHQETGAICTAELHPQFVGLEGRHVTVTSNVQPEPRSFLVGRSTGWVPLHLEIEPGEHGGGALLKSEHFTFLEVR